MDAKKMAAMIKVFKEAKKKCGIESTVAADNWGAILISGLFSQSYLYTELEKVFTEKGQT